MKQVFFLPESRFAIIAGRGELPRTLAATIKAAGHHVVLILISGEADQNSYADYDKITVSFGQVEQVLNFLRTQQIEYLLFAGGAHKPDLKSIKVDLKGGILLARLLKAKILGDDHLLRIVAKYFEEHNFKVLSPLDILENINTAYRSVGFPSKNDLKDIEIGIKAAKTIGNLDIGQAVIVENGCVIAVEAIEGTDQLIERTASFKRSPDKSAILVKVIKDNQDTRLDIPCVGPTTIEMLAKYNYAGLALEKDKVIIIDQEQFFLSAEQNGIFVHFFVS